MEENKNNKLEKILSDPKNLTIIVFLLVFCGILFYIININTVYNKALNNFKNKNYKQAYDQINDVYNSWSNYRNVDKYYSEIKYAYYLDLGDKNFLSKNFNTAYINYKKAKDVKNTDEINKKINISWGEIEKAEKLKQEKLQAEKKVKEAKINNLKNKMRLKYDKVENVTYIQDKTSSPYINSNSFNLFIAKTNTNADLWIRISYTGDNWIFFNKIILNIDGQKNVIPLDYYEVNRDNAYGEVWEFVNLDYNRYENLINKIINSKTTLIRLTGERYYDKTITNVEKQAMKRVIEYYNLIK